MTKEMGKPLTQSYSEVDKSINALESWFAQDLSFLNDLTISI